MTAPAVDPASAPSGLPIMAGLPVTAGLPVAAGLPIMAALPALLAALAEGPNAVLVAPPGAGKTTGVPLALLAAPWRGDGRILLLEPRRLAARAAADRMAATLGERVGETVGLRMRLETRVSARTRIEVMTEGVFGRAILADPELGGVAAVLFDEAHERSLDADLGLAFALDAQAGLRPDLRLLAMSATLDGARLATLLGEAPVIRSEGRAFPVETRHLGRDPGRRIEDEVADAVLRALGADPGSCLVFLPGTAEIRRVEARLGERLGERPVDILPLHGTLDRAHQERALRPPAAGRRKVVLATAVAETSLTVADVRIVVDCGLARVPVYEPGLGLTRLRTERVSRAAADQRRGRAGRTAPGICYRLWEEAATGSLEPFTRPEILSADLAPLLLDCAAWGVGDPTRLAFLDPPPAPALAEARKLLADLGALDGDERLTDEGRALGALPLPPRLARAVLAASRAGASRAGAEIAALLVERGLGGDAPDLAERLESWRRDTSRRADDVRRLARGWAETAAAIASADGAAHDRPPVSPGHLVALAFPDRIARARGGGEAGEFLLANGRGARVDPASPLARQPYLAVAEIVGHAASARIVSAAAITPAEIEGVAGERIVARDEVRFDPAARALRARALRRLGAVTLGATPIPVPATADNARLLARGLAGLGIAALPWSEEAVRLRARVAFLRSADPETWPDLSDGALARTVDDWLAPHLEGPNRIDDVSPARLDGALGALLPWPLPERLEREAPPTLLVPTGTRVPVAYDAEGGPAASVRVQELFGLDRHPTLAGGRIPVVLHLLSPAGRPIQVTRDLPGFWRGSWAEVRSAMRGRYPKHPWPEDPIAADPTRRVKARGT